MAQKVSKYSTKDIYKEDYDKRDKGGAKKISYLDISKFDGAKFYSIKEGRNELDIIPYIIPADKRPQGRTVGKASSIKVAKQLSPYIRYQTERGRWLDGRAESLLLAEYGSFGVTYGVCGEKSTM
jgi:hypothetical protein